MIPMTRARSRGRGRTRPCYHRSASRPREAQGGAPGDDDEADAVHDRIAEHAGRVGEERSGAHQELDDEHRGADGQNQAGDAGRAMPSGGCTLTTLHRCGQIASSDSSRSPHFSEEAVPWKP